MSRLTQFAAAGFQQARAIIGGELLTIGTASVLLIPNEVRTGRPDYDGAGHDVDRDLDVVADLAEFAAAFGSDDVALHGRTATVRSQQFRIQAVNRGQAFVTVRLIATDRTS